MAPTKDSDLLLYKCNDKSCLSLAHHFFITVFIVYKYICWAITISVGIYKWTLSEHFFVGRMLIFFLVLKMGRVIQINHPVCSSLLTFPSSTHMRRKRSSGESFEESGESAMEKRSRGDRGNRSDQILVVWLEVNLLNKEFLKVEFLIFGTAFFGDHLITFLIS